MMETTQKDYDQIERILLKFMTLSDEKKEADLKRAEEITRE
jgi:hypothetical protein